MAYFLWVQIFLQLAFVGNLANKCLCYFAFSSTPPKLYFPAERKQEIVIKNNLYKNRNEMCTSKIVEKSVDRKWHRPALTSDSEESQVEGDFLSKGFLYESVYTQIPMRFLSKFLIQNSFLTFYVHLLTTIFYYGILLNRH